MSGDENGRSCILTEVLPAASFLIRHLYRPVELGDGVPRFALAETEHPCQGDVWFWTDDNAKSLELLSRPEVWQRYPEQTAEILKFVRAMCDGPFIFRRVSVPRLEATGRTDDIESFCHALMRLRCDLRRGSVTAGIRFHDGRTADNLLLTGNLVEFSYKQRCFRLDVEDAIVDFEAKLEGDTLQLRHISELEFKSGWKTRRLGRLTYTYTVCARALPVGVEVALDLDPEIEVSDIVLGIGHDYLSHGANGVFHTTLMAERQVGDAVRYVASEPASEFVPAPGAVYYAIIQPEIVGLALAAHTVPRDPARLTGFDIVVTHSGFLHLVRARYRFSGTFRGDRLSIGEDKILTAGGFYDRTRDYAKIVGRSVAAGATQKNPIDFSISYDYGAELNAFAKCYAVCAGELVRSPGNDLPAELQGLFDRYLQHYFDVFVSGHQQRKNTIISRQLAFVILGVVTMYQATGEARYRTAVRRLCEVLLDFEIRYDDVVGTPVGAFAYGIFSQRQAYVDGHSASLLALTQARRCIDDPRLVQAIDRGLGAYCLETCAVVTDRPIKIDTIGTLVVDGPNRHTGNAFWNFNVGLAMRFFAALRTTADPALQAIMTKHRDRVELLETILRHQLESSIIERPDSVEIAVAPGGGETNSETQPWVTLGLFGHPFD